mgnify:FL=1
MQLTDLSRSQEHEKRDRHMIVLIAPYKKMKLIADSVINQFDIPIKTVDANLYEAIEPAKEAAAKGAILVSRGGTAKIIHQTLGVEVIEIGVSNYELLRVLRPYIFTNRKVAVVGFRSLTDSVEQICKILDIPVICFPVDSELEVESKIRSVADHKIECVIGDMISIQSAKGIDAELHLIESDEYAICEALEKAILIAKRLRLEEENDIRISAIFNSVQEAIIAIDAKGFVAKSNSRASELLNIPALSGKSIYSLIHDKELCYTMGKGREVSGKLEEINGKKIVINMKPLIMNNQVNGAVIVLQEVGKIQALERKVRRQLHAKGLTAKYTFQDIHTKASVMKSCIEVARQYARTESNIVLYGETGTGKELLAQSIHNESSVNDGPFVAINCGALPPTLLESELFGYVEGAFTGALRGGKVGLFELAHCGTIFLDEINELDFQLQSKLLRVLQEREIMRVGDTKIIPVSVRVIAASNVSLKEEVKKSRFRRDLYYRLNVLEIIIPPLRERKEDIEDLFMDYIARRSLKDNSPLTNKLSESLLKKLSEYSWPGNVRELENIAERYLVLYPLLGDQAELTIAKSLVETEYHMTDGVMDNFNLSGTLKDIDKRIIHNVFNLENRNIMRTAIRLGIDRQTVKKYLMIEPDQ